MYIFAPNPKNCIRLVLSSCWPFLDFTKGQRYGNDYCTRNRRCDTGYSHHCLANGKFWGFCAYRGRWKVLDLIDQVRPHVVILNYEFTDTTCIQLCRQIKEKYPHLPVLALSCNYNINQEYNKYGFDGYIEKPFDLDLLYQVMRKHIPKPTGSVTWLIFSRNSGYL